MESKNEAIKRLLKGKEELYVVSVDRIVENVGINDKDYLWFVCDDLSHLIWRTNYLIEELRTQKDYVELESPDLSKEVTTWDMQYTDEYTGETVRFVYLFETIKGL